MADRIEITVNGKPVSVVKDEYLLPALRRAGAEVPTLCNHKDLKPNGSCRLCLTEIEVRGRVRLVTACNSPVREPLKASTTSPAVLQHRKVLAEMLLGRWPNVPIIQQVAKFCGVTDGSRFTSELTEEDPKACVLCGHCTRACDEFTLERVLHFAGRGIKRHITMPFAEPDKHCIACTSCAHVCPTGAIQVTDALNNPVDPEMIRNAGMRVNAEMATLDADQCRMREVGTANIVAVMNQYDLLPVHNFRFGSHEDAPNIDHTYLKTRFTQGAADGCWLGCSMACAKTVDGFELRTGPYKGDKVCVEGPEYETAAASANMGCFNGDFLFEFNFYCDTYGLDTISVGTTVAFVMEAFEAGVINTKHTGGLELRFGATDAVLELLHQMARGEGFGVDVGQGIRWLKKKWAAEYGADAGFLQDIGMEVKGLEYSEYVSKESLAQQGGYALAIKGPQHDEAWLIFMDMVNKQLPSFEDKAEALYYFPLWRTWFGLNGLCKLVWNDVVPADNSKKYRPQEAAKIPDHVRGYFEFFEGMTGIPLDEAKMLDQSARVYNFQRVICRMLGYGTRKDDMPPYRSMGPVTAEEYESRAERYDKQLQEILKVDPASKSTEEKLKLLRAHREDQYNKLVDAVYARRGWTKDGVPKISRLKELGIDLPELVAIVEPDQEG